MERKLQEYTVHGLKYGATLWTEYDKIVVAFSREEAIDLAKQFGFSGYKEYRAIPYEENNGSTEVQVPQDSPSTED